MNCSEAKFYENYLTSDFHTNNVLSRRVSLPVKMASETVTRSMDPNVATTATRSNSVRVKSGRSLRYGIIMRNMKKLIN